MKYIMSLLMFLSIHGTAQYNFYYGNIHSHTDFSDGNRDSVISGITTPGGSFAYAKQSYHIDFWGISEHNHYTAKNNPGMLLARYAEGLYQADTSNSNGHFVAMYGMEFGTISTGGHVVTYGVPNLIGWDTVAGNPNYDIYCAKGDYVSYWNIVNSFPNAFCTLAHPETGDFNNLLLSPTFNPTADSVLIGTAIRSGSAFSTTDDYSDPPATSYELQYRRALAKGYHIGPAIDHDNHYTNFGRTLPGRTVVLAQQLHRDSILAAYKARRFYASDDWNTEVLFTINGSIMGSNIEIAGDPTIEIHVNDIDILDTTSKIQIYYGIPGSGIQPTVLSTTFYSNNFSFTHSIPLNSEYYYYAKITQTDGDILWTAPIWVKKTSFPLPIFEPYLKAELIQNNVQLSWILDGFFDFELQHSIDGISFHSINYGKSELGQNEYQFIDQNAPAGIQYYRLQLKNIEGEIFYSKVLSVLVPSKDSHFVLYPNPVRDILKINYYSFNSTKAILKIYNANGIQMQQNEIEIQQHENILQVNTSCLSGGLYYLVLQKENERLIDTKFIKL